VQVIEKEEEKEKEKRKKKEEEEGDIVSIRTNCASD